MTDRELLEQIVGRTESLNRTLQSTNPFALPNETRPIYQGVSDEVRVLSSDVRVALRNYDKVFAFYQEHHQPAPNLQLVASS